MGPNSGESLAPAFGPETSSLGGASGLKLVPVLVSERWTVSGMVGRLSVRLLRIGAPSSRVGLKGLALRVWSVSPLRSAISRR